MVRLKLWMLTHPKGVQRIKVRVHDFRENMRACSCRNRKEHFFSLRAFELLWAGACTALHLYLHKPAVRHSGCVPALNSEIFEIHTGSRKNLGMWNGKGEESLCKQPNRWQEKCIYLFFGWEIVNLRDTAFLEKSTHSLSHQQYNFYFWSIEVTIDVTVRWMMFPGNEGIKGFTLTLTHRTIHLQIGRIPNKDPSYLKHFQKNRICESISSGITLTGERKSCNSASIHA